MNYIDNNFDWLTQTIKSKTKGEIYEHIKDKYNSLSFGTKKSIEKFLSDFPYWGKLDFEEDEYEEIKKKTDSLYNHVDDFIWLYNHLYDYRSKKLLFAILYNWYDYDFNYITQCIENNFCHYFDLDIIKCEDEVFVDVGSYIGDTVLDFINSYGEECYKKIYCYDITEDSLEKLKENTKYYKNIICRNKALSDKEETLFINTNNIDASANTLLTDGNDIIEATTLDNDIKEKITMIKMDIEGYEEKALKGASKHILEDNPKLLISVYHNHEDLWKIPKLIDEIYKDYNFYLRFYGTPLFPTEIVLFAIKKSA